MPWDCNACGMENRDTEIQCTLCYASRPGFELFKKTTGNSINKTKDNLIITFGRFQPPTRGHKIIFDEMSKLAAEKNADAYVFIVDCAAGACTTNPLPKNVIVNTLKKMYASSNLKFTALENMQVGADNILKSLIETHKYPVENITIVIGSDRVSDFKEVSRMIILEKEERIRVAERALEELRQVKELYSGKEIQVVQAGQDRKEQNNGSPESISATKIRQAAIDGNKDLFNKGVMIGDMTPADALVLMNEIRKLSTLPVLQGGRRKMQKTRKGYRKSKGYGTRKY